jgi:hypothetical protein
MKKLLSLICLLTLTVCCLGACNFTGNTSGNPDTEVKADSKTEEMMLALAENRIDDAKALMYPEKADASAAGLMQIGKYLAGRGFTSIERLTVNTTTSVGTSGNTVQQQASYKVNLTDGEVVYLTLTYYTSDATEGFITFQLVLGAV